MEKRGKCGDSLDGTLRDGLYIKSQPSAYSADQIALYLTRIGFTPVEQTSEKFIEDGHFNTSLENLERLVRLHVLTFPYENTALHYTHDHCVDADPQLTYRRMMYERKGGLCSRHNTLFRHVLNGLGYRAYNISGRANVELRLGEHNPTRYSRARHVLVLVQLPDCNLTYMVDPGYTIGPISPMLLSESEKSVINGATATERFRLRRRPHPKSSLESRNAIKHGLWTLEVQHAKAPNTFSLPWMPLFSFSEEEYYEHDIQCDLVLLRLQPDAEQYVGDVIVSKYVLVDEEECTILDASTAAAKLAKTDVLEMDLGRVTLVGRELKFSFGTKSRIMAQIRTDVERIKVLREVYGMAIKDEAAQHIRGLPSALDVTESAKL